MLWPLPDGLPRAGSGLLLLPLGQSSSLEQKLYALCFAASYCQKLTVAAADFEPVQELLQEFLTRAAAALPADIVIDLGRPTHQKCDFVFGLSADDQTVATSLEAQFIPVNIEGEIDAFNLVKHFESADKIKPRKICVLGPESTGKSTLAKDLAGAFSATLVPEYAREHIKYRKSELGAHDLELIARGQFVSQAILSAAEKNILIADSDLLTTSLYAEALFGACPAWIEELSRHPDQIFDLYLLTSPEVPWVDDAHRVDKEGRAKFFEGCQQKLIARDLPYVLIEGDWQKRFDKGVNAVKELVSKA